MSFLSPRETVDCKFSDCADCVNARGLRTRDLTTFVADKIQTSSFTTFRGLHLPVERAVSVSSLVRTGDMSRLPSPLRTFRRLAQGKTAPSLSTAPLCGEPHCEVSNQRTTEQWQSVHVNFQSTTVGGVGHSEVQVANNHFRGHPSRCTLKCKPPSP